MSLAPLLDLKLLDEGPPRKCFTRQEVERLSETGIFEGQRYELIDGDLIDKMGQKPAHAFTIHLVLDWLTTFLEITRLQVQMPIETAGEDRERSVPEPDLAVLVELKTEYQERHPRGDELILAVEISDSSVFVDLSRKAILYARAGIPEYWVLDLVRRLLVVHRQPDGTQYRQIHIYAEDDFVSIQGRDEKVRVRNILPNRP